ncbi:hypothetical protein FKG94_08955 [Exilibacterium tricleocarpae]|uniref:AAA+ ATPase domain-containing protein n=1 Tax=Exilibacterium tricleocarpae TaxID=2591008 RepID=A0A545TVI9_9GAMM|nr:AAA domain-containing protein [Exilibacterium tricleocarpae]TQV81222.1 hypothetical protein FKG94_08955 [Exilibacterium tricleocarpae]
MKNSIFKRANTDTRLSRKGDRHNIFHIQRFKNDHGFYVYTLENAAEQKKIFIPRFIFGRFRAILRTLLKTELSKAKPEPFESSAVFLNREYFYFKSSRMDLDHLIIQDIEERQGSSGYITVSRRCLPALDQLLYDEKLQHPNDVLEEIISYHKLFQFSFVKGSTSITSDLALRKDVLQKTGRYYPKLAEKLAPDGTAQATAAKSSARSTPQRGASGRKADVELYRPKLGERLHEKNITVDYQEIFADKNLSLKVAAGNGDDQEAKKGGSKESLSQFSIPLSAHDVKAFEKDQFYFELGTTESTEFRDRFIADRSSEFYLGFEIVDALFTYNRSLRSFQFPLYYMKVSIRESGRGVHLTSKQDGRFYLNHLALAHLVEKFSETAAGVDQVDKFFQTLLAQTISIDQLNDRIHLVRHLPVKEDIFDRTREILFGYRDENGKGGILSELKVSGIECDLQGVYLYRAQKLLSPIDQALEHDLDHINLIAHQSMQRFYNSLLGRFLTPELARDLPPERQPRAGADGKRNTTIWMPGSPPQSTRKLLDGLDHHDLVLLEGPPGTGKTHTIMNLLIHCISSNQRVLVVSDQQAAIEALMEKLQQYLVGSDRGTPAERRWKELLLSAVNVVDDVQVGEQALADCVAGLTKAFKVQELGSGASHRSGNLEKKMLALREKIAGLTAQIADKMLAHMGEEVPFAQREPSKHSDGSPTRDLLAFLQLLTAGEGRSRALIDAFVANRDSLIRHHMEACYQFFKLPAGSRASEMARLQDDEKVLSLILEKKVEDLAQFQVITADHPRHELIRYLEEVIQLETADQGGELTRITRKIRAGFRSHLMVRTKRLQRMVQDQIALLDCAGNWSDGVWALLRDIHECIRTGEEPSRALNLYRGIARQSGATGKSYQGGSIQGDLEQIEDLYQQQDKVVKERFAGNLRRIIQAATAPKRGGGTNAVTSIMALVDNLKQFTSIADSGSVFEELRQKLYDTFPVWVVRKQVVPFLLPCTEQSFDLVIVDEATQCRVDDAISLLFRAKKMLVVGDDKQTVLQKDSIIDDYLFKDHELDEHLRSTQARGFKGGGSHIFALVKAIKQAAVMLDEHYRCPADIIEFSNKYVYDGELKVMQWQLPEQPPSVAVDYSEQAVTTSKKPRSGKFRGIETEMIDRYLDYVARSIGEIEKSTGTTVNLETDVALCYFLLKNQPYVKSVKDKFLRKVNRGEDILDGAGAALQGKERDYVFYFWDITRYNLSAYKQGDDADKRKGELNVLMSRPKKKAFHYLHNNFEQLEHGRTQITRYLWQSLMRQQEATETPGSDAKASAQPLISGLLKFTLEHASNRSAQDIRQSIQGDHIDFREDIAIGDTRHIVDVIAFPRGAVEQVVGLVDLSGFDAKVEIGQEIVDYFFQLKRAAPAIDPVFVFPYEIIDENSQTFRSLIYKLEHMETEHNRKQARRKEA